MRMDEVDGDASVYREVKAQSKDVWNIKMGYVDNTVMA